MTLKLVPPRQPTAKEEMVLRHKRMRPDGKIMCNRCGGTTMLTTRTGAYIRKGRIVDGTITDKNVCAHCWKQGIYSPMLPELQPIK
jgi:hypothetical protein